jgi:hypothetical protein
VIHWRNRIYGYSNGTGYYKPAPQQHAYGQSNGEHLRNNTDDSAPFPGWNQAAYPFDFLSCRKSWQNSRLLLRGHRLILAIASD